MNMILICLSAFVVVFTILAILSIVMRLIMLFFAEKKVMRPALVAAIVSTLSTIFPGSKITKIEEMK